ncbi:MAG TPA: hypothetical protein VHL11_00040, partial [Phototrophicaceae bacterium]|nr:hypothetical protein [Phototrophicaceae bacterium]
MNHLTPTLPVRWVVSGLLLTLLSFAPFSTSVHAEVACLNTIPVTDGTDNDLNLTPYLSGRSLLWSRQTGELFRYDTETGLTDQIGLIRTEYPSNNYLTADDDHVVWIDPQSQVQLYIIATDTTQQLTDGSRLNIDPQVEGNYVL